MKKRMVIMLVVVGLLFGGIFGWQTFKTYMMKKYMAGAGAPPQTVSTLKTEMSEWQPQMKAVGTLRAIRGVEVTTEIAGLVRSLHFKSGDKVNAGQVLVQLNADSDIAQLRSTEAAAELAQTVYERDKKQYEARAISKAALDADAADLKSKQAQVAQLKAIVEKKTIRAPFAGRLGITTVNRGHYLNPGDRIVTLQALDSVYVDFFLPQQELARLAVGQSIIAKTDTYPNRTFQGKVTALNPKVEADTRNVLVQATVANQKNELLPGMFASVEVKAGGVQKYLTVPQTAVAYNPYGETIYIVEESGKGPDDKPVMTAKQTFVTVGPTRGDQVAILKGIKEGDIVVTSGQMKLKNGSTVIINNQVQPSNDPAPALVQE